MQLLKSSLVLLFAGSVLASPTPATTEHKKKRSFKIDLVKRSDYLPDGPAALRKAYRKFGIVATDIALDSLDFEPISLAATQLLAGTQGDEPDENGAVSATPVQNDVEYLAPVTIGGQKFVMNFDTGSADT